MTSRAALPGDITWLVATTLESYAHVFAPLLPASDWSVFDAAHFEARFSRDLGKIWICEREGRKGGFFMLTAGHLDMVFVAADHRGTGFGAAMLADAEIHGANSLECFAANAGARRFYARQGWREVSASSREFAGQSCDFVRMEKPRGGPALSGSA